MQCTVFLLNSPPPDSVRTVVTMNLYEARWEEHGDSPNPRQLNVQVFPPAEKMTPFHKKTNFCSLCTGKCGCCYGSVAIWSCCYSLVFNQILALRYYHAIAKLFFHKKNAVYFLIWKHVFFCLFVSFNNVYSTLAQIYTKL